MSERRIVSLVTDQDVAVISVHNPPVNTITAAVRHELAQALDALDKLSGVRAVALICEGSTFFSGADIGEFSGPPREEEYRSLFARFEALPIPVVAAMHGTVLGGGCEIALACHYRIADPRTRFGFPEVTLGIIPGAGGTQRLPRIVGEARAKEMILLGRPIKADLALAWGLVNRVTPPGVDVVADTIELIAPIANGAPIAQAAALAAIDDSFDVTLEQGLALERVHYDETLRSQDRLEALRAFAEKRKPAFSGT